jgi:hypothetical protein
VRRGRRIGVQQLRQNGATSNTASARWAAHGCACPAAAAPARFGWLSIALRQRSCGCPAAQPVIPYPATRGAG